MQSQGGLADVSRGESWEIDLILYLPIDIDAPSETESEWALTQNS